VAARPADAVLAHAAAERARVDAEDVGGAAGASAVPWRSTKRPLPVRTMFTSTSADESSS
jgi:hypothetical protein